MSNFITPVFRVFIKHLKHNVINVIGVCLGLAVSTLCFLLIQYEFSFDKGFSNADDIYRIVREDRDNNAAISFSQGTSSMLSPTIKETIPDVLRVSRFFNNGVTVHQPDSVDLFGEGLAVVDTSFYEIFSLKFIKGNLEHTLNKPYGVVLTKRTAEVIFKDTNPIGKTLVVQGFYFPNLTFEVTGVVEDLPRNTSIRFDMLTTESSFMKEWLWHSWQQTSGYLPVQTFVQTKKDISLPGLTGKLNDLIKSHFDVEYHSKIKYHLQPLKRIHLYSQSDYNLGSGGNIAYISFFIVLTVLIFSIVTINFLNISKTLYQSRMVENGVKKVFGSTTWKFVVGFFLETGLLILLCLPIVLLLVYLTIPIMNEFLFSNISFDQLANSTVFFKYLLLIVLFVLAIGVFPSFRFSSMKPIQMLTKQAKAKRKRHSNNILVIVQFSIAIILIISTLHVNKQFLFMINKDLGFNKENILILPILGNDPELREDCERVKSAFMENSAIVAASASHSTIGTYAEQHSVKPSGHEEMNIWGIGVDSDFIPFYGLKLIQGRNFRKDSEFDQNSVILNKKAADALGWKDAVGKKFDFRGRKGQVIGVVEDFNLFSLDQTIAPAYLQLELPKNVLALKYQGNDLAAIEKFVNEKQRGLSPNNIPEVYRLSSLLQEQYEGARRTMRIFGIFALLAIVLSCIGLFGLVIELCQSRVKEIGIRKVNGATVLEMMVLLNRDFFKCLLISYILAVPIAWYVMSQWFNGFAYRIPLNWILFVLAGVLVFGIALLTVSWQSWRAATRNPVKSLRYE
jgi:putative ABC transport system permease protein